MGTLAGMRDQMTVIAGVVTALQALLLPIPPSTQITITFFMVEQFHQQPLYPLGGLGICMYVFPVMIKTFLLKEIVRFAMDQLSLS